MSCSSWQSNSSTPIAFNTSSSFITVFRQHSILILNPVAWRCASRLACFIHSKTSKISFFIFLKPWHASVLRKALCIQQGHPTPARPTQHQTPAARPPNLLLAPLMPILFRPSLLLEYNSDYVVYLEERKCECARKMRENILISIN